ncbi:MAG: WecB/TagA/CpsF family glycosyltransferase [Selenomonadaceae bacterium]|nr:WecB/TagA/CpsF family glycosyltransferase [Selenomonadaceae bacterium]
MKAEILGVNVDCLTMTQAVEQVDLLVKNKTPSIVATANAEMLMFANSDAELKKILNSAAIVTADGAGTVWAARHLGYEMPERVAGVDLVTNLFSKGYRFYFFGSAAGVADLAAENAAKKFNAKIVGTRNGFFTAEEIPKILDDINNSNAEILLAALGVPKQEKFLYNNLKNLNVPVNIGVGGTLDVLAGKVKRAPRWMQRAKLEWLFRALLQPSRAGRLLALPKFVYNVHKSRH